jgi:hypothetical protein
MRQMHGLRVDSLLKHGMHVGQFACFFVYGDSAMLECCRSVLATDYLRQQITCGSRRLGNVMLGVLSF